MTGQTISRAVTLETVDEFHRSGRPYTVPVILTFDPAAPFEVVFSFPRGTCKQPWVISRDLLIDGMIGHVGIADVQVHPISDSLIGIRLESDTGSVQLQMNRETLARFLSDTASTDDFLPDLEQWMTEATP